VKIKDFPIDKLRLMLAQVRRHQRAIRPADDPTTDRRILTITKELARRAKVGRTGKKQGRAVADPSSSYWKKLARKAMLAVSHLLPCDLCELTGTHDDVAFHHLLCQSKHSQFRLDPMNVVAVDPGHHKWGMYAAAHSEDCIRSWRFGEWVRVAQVEQWQWVIAHECDKLVGKPDYRKYHTFWNGLLVALTHPLIGDIGEWRRLLSGMDEQRRRQFSRWHRRFFQNKEIAENVQRASTPAAESYVSISDATGRDAQAQPEAPGVCGLPPGPSDVAGYRVDPDHK
jgi:hypothetical protein